MLWISTLIILISAVDETEQIRHVDKETNSFDLSLWEGHGGGNLGEHSRIEQTFVIDDMGEDVVYLAILFSTTASSTWKDSESIIMTLDGEVLYTAVLDPSTDQAHKFIQALKLVANSTLSASGTSSLHRFTVGFMSNIFDSNSSFSIHLQSIGVYTRRQTAVEFCGPSDPTGSEEYPVFDVDQSGFVFVLEGATFPTDLVRFKIDVPRFYYSFTAGFDGGLWFTGYDESRTHTDNVTEYSETYWEWSGHADDACGYETITATIPWGVLNREGGGGLLHLEQWSNGTHIFTDDFYYNFGGTALMTAREWIYTTVTSSSGASREWEVERKLTWRVPFVIRMQKFVNIWDNFEHMMTCSAMHVPFQWTANSTEETNLLLNLLDDQTTITFEDICKDQCHVCHGCNCTYDGEVSVLRTTIARLTQEMFNLEQSTQQFSDKVSEGTLLLSYINSTITNSTSEWESAVQDGGLSCAFVPHNYCDNISGCSLDTGPPTSCTDV